jgi:hypothetical protein
LQARNKSFRHRIQQSSFFIKLFNWEYWPIYIVNIPVVFIWLWFAFRARDLFFFSAVNPAIETGGVMGESKINILNRLPKQFVPKTIFIKKGTDFEAVLRQVQKAGLGYPLIAKPNVGERGLLVSKIKCSTALKQYVAANKVDFLVQEFVDLPMELSVLHYRFPGEKKGEVTSLCIKESLKVQGDGLSSIRQLMEDLPRAKLQLPRFENDLPRLLETVPGKEVMVELEPIGNHSRGTLFLNGNKWIDKTFTRIFDAIAFEMEGIHYGRFDLKCSSMEELKLGQKIHIFEFNGIASEPAHIYDPDYPFLKKYADIFRHWKIIFAIYKKQKALGIKSMTLKEALQSLKDYFSYMKSLKA